MKLVSFFILVCFCLYISPVVAQTVYQFTGNGNWNNSGNWINDTVAPKTVSNGTQIIINPQTGGKCILNAPLQLLPGSVLTVLQNKKFLLTDGTYPAYPADVLDLHNWKLNLPIDANGAQTGVSLEIKRTQLDTFSIIPYFHNNSDNTGVIFNANCGGATTSGSGYPRSELREMTSNGTVLASWTSTVGVHTMEIDQAVTHLPDIKNQIVLGQIHDASNDLIVFRLEGTKLFMDHNGTRGTVIDPNYVLGTRFIAKFVVFADTVYSFYNSVLKETYPLSFSGAYFKAGAYVQSSCKGSKQVAGESCNAYGEVIIYKVTVTHN